MIVFFTILILIFHNVIFILLFLQKLSISSEAFDDNESEKPNDYKKMYIGIYLLIIVLVFDLCFALSNDYKKFSSTDEVTKRGLQNVNYKMKHSNERMFVGGIGYDSKVTAIDFLNEKNYIISYNLKNINEEKIKELSNIIKERFLKTHNLKLESSADKLSQMDRTLLRSENQIQEEKGYVVVIYYCKNQAWVIENHSNLSEHTSESEYYTRKLISNLSVDLMINTIKFCGRGSQQLKSKLFGTYE